MHDDHPTLAAPSGRVGVTLAVAGAETRFKTYGWNEPDDPEIVPTGRRDDEEGA